MISLIVSSLLAAGAIEENAAGMKLYQAKNYPLALERFRAAIADEKTTFPSVKEQVAHTRARALANFNLACTLSLLRKARKVCEFDAYRGTIMGLVRQSIALDPNRLERALVDADLQSIRDTVEYQSLLGLSFSREADLPKLLPRVSWWSQGVGAFGSTKTLAFKADGTVQFGLRVLDDNGLKPPRFFAGRWLVKGRTLTLTFAAPLPAGALQQLEFTLTDEGRLSSPGDTFSDAPSECDA